MSNSVVTQTKFRLHPWHKRKAILSCGGLLRPIVQESMNTIDEHIQKDQSEIQSAKAQGDNAKVRHLTEELNSLEEYKEHHPEDKHDPNALELFCEANPDEPECLVYDD